MIDTALFRDPALTLGLALATCLLAAAILFGGLISVTGSTVVRSADTDASRAWLRSPGLEAAPDDTREPA